ncbi:cytochrome P450 89A9-like [Juglans regia]|uniref:Cytochrome P450 89A9-like n=1 Tax=Juglans regia TaxID=51240 RepID=A0A6P9EB15_JUGRE|nr:cytochrome P450 89A9-like [Juglans regia]
MVACKEVVDWILRVKPHYGFSALTIFLTMNYFDRLNFMVAKMGWDPKVWEDPMAFRPERFLRGSDGGGGGVFDITGSWEIKMMPFGAGRRMCPGSGLAMLHLEYFVANLVWNFEWKAMNGDDVDLSEKQEFTMVMKDPLKVNLSPRL